MPEHTTAAGLRPKTMTAVTATVTAAAIGSRFSPDVQRPVHGFLLQALSTNTVSVYVGDSSVTSSNGIELEAGKSLFVAGFDPSTIYVVTASGTANVRVMFV